MEVSIDLHDRKIKTLSAMEAERQLWWPHWRTCADYYMPRRYNWLTTPQERMNKLTRNTLILDATGTTSGRTLQSGLMNGITSPSRPWLRLRIAGFEGDNSARIWLDEVTHRMLVVMAETNFYNAMGVVYGDLAFFGTAACLIYEDFEDVFRCYNPSLGEFYLGQDDRNKVNKFAREFQQTVDQLVRWFGLENCSDTVQQRFKQGGSNKEQVYNVAHLIEPNDDGPDKMKGGFTHREYYWEIGAPKGRILKRAGYNEIPGVFPRWEVTGNDSYGSGWPAADALGDVIQLQHETKKKGQALDKTVDPPVLADIQLKHQPMALLPRGVTYVAGVNNVGVKAAYQIQMPFDQLSADINEVRGRIREIFFNDLFKMISQLDTVRSATEIDARREEKLVLLGPTYERFENEALDPGVRRVYSIMNRARLLPEAPESILGRPIQVQYVNVLASAQTAVATIPVERFLGLVGNVTPIWPEARFIPNIGEIVRDYGRDLGVRAKNINSPEVSQQMQEAEAADLEAQKAAATGEVLVNSAKQLSETDVGGGANALSRLINPFNPG